MTTMKGSWMSGSSSCLSEAHENRPPRSRASVMSTVTLRLLTASCVSRINGGLLRRCGRTWDRSGRRQRKRRLRGLLGGNPRRNVVAGLAERDLLEEERGDEGDGDEPGADEEYLGDTGRDGRGTDPFDRPCRLGPHLGAEVRIAGIHELGRVGDRERLAERG